MNPGQGPAHSGARIAGAAGQEVDWSAWQELDCRWWLEIGLCRSAGAAAGQFRKVGVSGERYFVEVNFMDGWIPIVSIMGAIITGGIALAGMILSGQSAARRNTEVLDVRLAALEKGQGDLRERMAHLEGLLEGLREAITRSRAA